MSSRERWTVYPLLFLTLGIATKDKLTRMVHVDTLVCRRLQVTDERTVPQVMIAANQPAGFTGVYFVEANESLVPTPLVRRAVPRPIPQTPPVAAQPANSPEPPANAAEEPAKAPDPPPAND